MRILLADPSEKILNLLNQALAAQCNVQIVGTVAKTEKLIALARQSLPDLVLLDWQLAKSPAQAVIPRLHQLGPDLKVVAMFTHLEDGRAALTAGADVIISKSDPPDWLLAAVRRLVVEAERTPLQCHDMTVER